MLSYVEKLDLDANSLAETNLIVITSYSIHYTKLYEIRVGLNNDEFVTAEAGKGIPFTDELFEALGYRAQNQVADGVPLGIVDGFKPIDVKEKDADLVIVTPRPGDGLQQTVIEQCPVGKTGQVVAVGSYNFV